MRRRGLKTPQHRALIDVGSWWAGSMGWGLGRGVGHALSHTGMGGGRECGAARWPVAPGPTQFSAGARSGLMLSNNLDLRPDSQPQTGHGLVEVAPWSSYRTMTARGLIEARGML